MISPGKRWFLYRAVSAGGVMPGRLSWGSLGHTRNITRSACHGSGSRVNKLTKPFTGSELMKQTSRLRQEIDTASSVDRKAGRRMHTLHRRAAPLSTAIIASLRHQKQRRGNTFLIG